MALQSNVRPKNHTHIFYSSRPVSNNVFFHIHSICFLHVLLTMDAAFTQYSNGRTFLLRIFRSFACKTAFGPHQWMLFSFYICLRVILMLSSKSKAEETFIYYPFRWFCYFRFVDAAAVLKQPALFRCA